VCREYFTHHIKYLITPQFVTHLPEAAIKLLHHPAFTSVYGNEIQNEAILLLPITVNSAHTLFKPNRIPWYVIVYHEPAELKVDAFPGSFSGNKHLGSFTEFTLGINAGALHISVSYLHAAVELGHGETPEL